MQSQLHRSFTFWHDFSLVRPERLRKCLKSSQYRARCAQKLNATMTSFEDFIVQKQAELIKDTENLDGSGVPFKIDKWDRDPSDKTAGFGITAVLEGGKLLEKAAVNVSVIKGKLSPERAQAMSSRGRNIDQAGGQDYAAAALSLVFHPLHPFVPTLRADVRRFEVQPFYHIQKSIEIRVDGYQRLELKSSSIRKVAEDSWYGGGCDLTPAYFFNEDTRDFHRYWHDICETHKQGSYSKYKDWCDKYFFIPARKEHRGVGGIFFDDLTSQEHPGVEQFAMSVANGILPSWMEIALKRRELDYTEPHRDWQLLRRGRYLEFNLLYDRGVRFGLGGRIESVMVSAPPLIAWKYNVLPKPGTPEYELLEVLRSPRDWL